MKISYQWLREWVGVKLDPRALAERLTGAGIEVGALEPVAPPLSGVVVGEVVSVSPHPAAERLSCCKVRTGAGKTVDVVCGAPNVVAGMRAPLALPGARLAAGEEIRETEIRGVRSHGMLCSAEELGLGEAADGLMDLGRQAPVGKALAVALALDDVTLEIELTPNRGDCLSITGIAREAAALTGAKLRLPRRKAARVTSRAKVKVVLDAPRDCPRYVGRVIENIDPHAATPLWMSERLRRSGLRAIHPVVDVTNYVLLELGQPMHAFDRERLTGAVRARHARKGESLKLLDGKTIELPPGALVIADDAAPLALAGVMGGEASAVGGDTRHVFLESAYFRPEAIAGRARALGLQTDSSYRFERGVDPTLQRKAIDRATELLLQIAGGKAGPTIEKTVARHLPRRKAIPLRAARAGLVLGFEVPKTVAERILKRLGMRLARARHGWRVTPPAHRFDIAREEDLIEEVARVYGYDRLPGRLPTITMPVMPVSEKAIGEPRVRAALVDRDYREVITYSFVDPELNRLVDPNAKPAALANPISADMAVMRTSLWPGLLKTLLHNLNRQQSRVRLFEIGRCFLPQAQGYDQGKRLGGLVSGTALAEQWGSAARPVDLFDAKGDIEALFALTGRTAGIDFHDGTHPALHPGQASEIRIADRPIGHIGALHPEIQGKLGLEQTVVLYELDLSCLLTSKIPNFREISAFPSIRRDIAIIVSDSIRAGEVLELVKKVAGNLLVKLELFDQYRGKGIDSGRKSLAVGLTLQDSSRTLKESEVEEVLQRVVTALETQVGAQLRR
jgi:phenylalanyl-tRNA synthetase beta chain